MISPLRTGCLFAVAACAVASVLAGELRDWQGCVLFAGVALVFGYLTLTIED